MDDLVDKIVPYIIQDSLVNEVIIPIELTAAVTTKLIKLPNGSCTIGITFLIQDMPNFSAEEIIYRKLKKTFSPNYKFSRFFSKARYCRSDKIYTQIIKRNL